MIDFVSKETFAELKLVVKTLYENQRDEDVVDNHIDYSDYTGTLTFIDIVETLMEDYRTLETCLKVLGLHMNEQ